MKIRIKILLGYVLLATLVALVGLVGYRSTHQVGQSFDEAINRTQPVVHTLQEIRFHALVLLADAYRSTIMSNGKHGWADEREGGDSIRFAELDAATMRYQALVTAHFPDEVADAAEIVEEVGAFKEAIHTLHSRSTLPAAAVEAFDALPELIAGVLRHTAEAATGELEEFSAHQQGVADQVATQEGLIAGIALIAFLVAVGGGLNISGRVAHPVIALRDAVRKLGRGQFDTRVAVSDNSEVGELSAAFNTMATQLAGSMVSREYVENIIDSMAEGLVVVDVHGHIERVNQAFRALIRCADDYPLQDHLIVDFIPDTHILENALNSPVNRHWIETEMRTADGELLVVALSVANLHGNNVTAGSVVLVQDITERKQNDERLTYLARYDALTGLPNRTLLVDHLSQSLTRQPWKKEVTAILFCDLDRFKFVNDTLGHGLGDLLLQRIAERLHDCVRPGDVVARWSGDEFVVLLNDVAQSRDAERMAEKICGLLSKPIQIGAHELYITASIGVSIAPEHAIHADELVKCADMAMYAAKAKGKNTHCLYTMGMAERSQERLLLEQALRHALQEGGQLQVHYQAQQRMDGPLIGFEALVRWRHPELGLISPANFLPTAEEAGLMAAIDETVMHIACAQARDWLDEGVAGLRISVNISNDLFRRGDLPKFVSELLVEYGIPPSAIELELTEAIVMSDIESSIRTMHRIRDLGVELSIDDFGIGYSSLAHLKRCPIQMLKIDRSFVNDVMTDPNDAAITEAITALAHKMGIQVIAEGVETVDQLRALRQYGCDAIQGYYLSKPIPAAALPEFLRRTGHSLGAGNSTALQMEESAPAY